MYHASLGQHGTVPLRLLSVEGARTMLLRCTVHQFQAGVLTSEQTAAVCAAFNTGYVQRMGRGANGDGELRAATLLAGL